MERLPRDIITEILSRIPIRYIARSSYTCKTWRAIVCDPLFSRKIHNRSRQGGTNPTTIIYGYRPKHWYKKEQRKLLLVEDDNEEKQVLVYPSIELKNIRSSNQKQPYLLGSCNSLLCLGYGYSVRGDNNGDKYCYCIDHIILNLITGERQILPAFEYCKVAYGFGYDVSRQKYKVVIIRFYKFKRSKKIQSEVLVCTVQSSTNMNAWRRISDAAPSNIFEHENIAVLYSMAPALVDGSHHWICSSNYSTLFIMVFHLRREEFNTTPTPASLRQISRVALDNQWYRITVLQGCLSLVDFQPYNVTHIWLVKNYNDKKEPNWIKKFSLLYDSDFSGVHLPIMVRKNGEILLLFGENNEFLASYNPETFKYKCIRRIEKSKVSWLGPMYVAALLN